VSSKFDPHKYHRRSTRVPGYDYSQPDKYFVTIVTHQREYIFGEDVDEEVRLNDYGNRIHNYIQANPLNWHDDAENTINAH